MEFGPFDVLVVDQMSGQQGPPLDARRPTRDRSDGRLRLIDALESDLVKIDRRSDGMKIQGSDVHPIPLQTAIHFFFGIGAQRLVDE